jgi:hypothetical protein
MKRPVRGFLVFFLLVTADRGIAIAHDDIAIWREFAKSMLAGDLPPEVIRPYYENMREPLTGFLRTLRAEVSAVDWEKEPEVHRVGNQVHFILPLTQGKNGVTYCFSFITEKGRWFFQHLESITIRLDRLPPLPTSSFPDIPEKQKAWMRQEKHWSQMLQLFKQLSQERGRDLAFKFFLDGAGYFLEAKTWVPIVAPSKAFILYLCWEQANLHGNDVTLEKLTENEALVRMESIFLRLYGQTGHFRHYVSADDYRQIFETIWQDRAKNAGWSLVISIDGSTCLFRFTKPSQSE